MDFASRLFASNPGLTEGRQYRFVLLVVRATGLCGLILVFLCACPRAGEESLRKGHAYFSTGDLDKAAIQYEAAAEAAPKSARGPEARGNVAFERGKIDLAIKWYEKAVSINPQKVSARHKLALSLANKGQLDAAIEQLTKAVEIANDNPYARHTMGGLYKKQGRLQKAEAEQLAALDVDPKYHAARFALGNLMLDQGRSEDAERQFEILVSQGKTSLADYGFARIAGKAKDAKTAAKKLNKVLDSGVSEPLRILDDSAFKGLWMQTEMRAIYTRLSTVTSTQT